jgi:phosphoesterase RecJ-like protein
MSLAKISQVIRKHKHFLLTTHVNPDPDALCSELALASCLKKLKKNVMIVNDDILAERFKFLPGSAAIKRRVGMTAVNAEVVIVLDCGDLGRIGRVRELVSANQIIVNIDHHVTNDFFGHINWVCPKASSTAEVLYEFFRKEKFAFSRDIALNLYVGIMTDTGSFRYDNTSSKTHQLVSELMQFNFSPAKLYQKLYEAIPLQDLKEFARVMSSFQPLYDGKVICIELKRRVLAKFSEEFDLKDTIFKFLRSLKGIEVVVILSELSSQRTRVNFRSAGEVDVAKLAQQFKGGGHQKASGCLLNLGIKQTRQKILESIEKAL